jgi:predicted RNA-binding Zn-ribbon protein involved in translation (DUF1610 family)
MEYPLTVSVRADLRAQGLYIFVSDGEETYPVTFTNRPAKAFCQHEDDCGEEPDDHWYCVVLENGEEIVVDSIDLDFELDNQVYCSNENCDYGTENDQQGNWAFDCPECGQENIVFESES